jgi:hypothetical protein
LAILAFVAASGSRESNGGCHMNEYELADYTTSVMGNFLTAISIYFTIATAYVIAAFSAGERLSTLQIIIVNVSFTIAAGTIGTLSIIIFDRFFELAMHNQGVASTTTALIDFTFPISFLVLVIYVGCLAFMWNIRSVQDDA